MEPNKTPEMKDVVDGNKVIVGNCRYCDRGEKPNSASGTHHVYCNDVRPSAEYSERCGNIPAVSYNLVWDNSVTTKNDFRSNLLGKPMFDMRCSKCLSFIGAYHSPEYCKDGFCHNCGGAINQLVQRQ